MNRASCAALCPPTTSAVNHNVTETDYLAASFTLKQKKKKKELQETVLLMTFINHSRRRIYPQYILKRLHKF